MTPAANQQLERDLLAILQDLTPPDPESSPEPEVLTLADPSYLGELFGSPLAAWEQGYAPFGPTPLLETIAAHPAAHRQLLASDVDFAGAVRSRAADIEFVGTWGIRSAAFPLVVPGRVIHCLWVRHYLSEPVTDPDLTRLAECCGCDPDELRPQAGPVLTAQQVEAMLARARETRDALQAALEQHLHAGEMVHQLVESERTRSLGTLSGGIAHRFNNLLSVILGYASFVQNREELSAAADDALHKIGDAAQQGRRLTEEILAFAGSEVEQEVPCRVHETLSSILSLLQSQTSSSIAIETALHAELDTVIAPPSAVHQLIFNLLSDGLDRLPDGGDLSIESANDTGPSDTGPVLRLTITTSSPSESVAADDETLAAGAGSRMAQALAMAVGLNGTLTQRADANGRTVANLRLPMGSAPETESPPVPGPRRVIPAHIWVVDDDPIFRQMCEKVLADDGHRTVLLESGRELQDRWNGGGARPDLLIIDFSMPEYNGLELCTWLKEQGSTCPVILVSGFSETQPDIHRALQLRKTHFLRKPFSFREILDHVTVALGETFIGSGQ